MLTVLCWDHPRCTGPTTAAAAAWERLHPGTTVRVLARSLADFNDQPLEQAVEGADVVFVDHPLVARAAATGILLPLDAPRRANGGGDLDGSDLDGCDLETIAADALGASHRSYTVDGRQWAVGVDAACQTAAIGARLLDDLGDLPHVWSEVLELARRRPGSVALPLYPSDAFLALLSISRQYGGTDDDPWRPEAVALFCELVTLVDPRSWDWNPPAALDAVSLAGTGYLPLTFCYSLYQDRPPAERVVFGVPPSVAGQGSGPPSTVLGGAGLAVPSSSGNAAAARAFALWFASPSVQAEIVPAHGGQPASATAWRRAADAGLAGGFFRSVLAVQEATFTRPPTRWWPEYQDHTGRLLVDALRAGHGPERIHRQLTDSHAARSAAPSLEGDPG